MPFSYEDFFSFYRTEFLPAYTIVYNWIDYENVDINVKAVEILTSVANSFNSISDSDEKDRHQTAGFITRSALCSIRTKRWDNGKPQEQESRTQIF